MMKIRASAPARIRTRKTILSLATGLALAAACSAPVYAQSATGAVAGRAEAGAEVTISNPDTGFTRSVTADADGSYRLPLLPPGNYTLQSAGSQPVQVAVSLGNTTNVNLGGGGATTLGAVQVVGSRIVTPVDVTSTESATNINRQQIERIPVERSVSSVAVLAPGVARGTAGFGGISFGGSSVAENAFYVNGLNVTDFYNRVGFSEAPFDFYQEFQVKTGGYSVEFGRTTGGVVNALARSGTNEFHGGAKLIWGPRDWESEARDSYNDDGSLRIARSKDTTDSTRLNVWGSGPIIKDRLFFFAMYEGRQIEPESTNSAGTTFSASDSNDGFWGATLDWQVTDNNLLSLMAFSNENRYETTTYDYDFETGERGEKLSDSFSESGGKNWALTWTSYLTDDLSMKLMHGRMERTSAGSSLNNIDCNSVSASSAIEDPGVPLGCASSSTISDRSDEREQTRADFEWVLGDHLLRFGYDREVNVSDHSQRYSGPGGYSYSVSPTTPGAIIPDAENPVPDGYTAYVRQRRYEIFGEFESNNQAFYLEDNWSITDNFLLNLGLRYEQFENKDAEGNTYIEMDDMIAPRLGFSWDVRGDGSMKLFGNVGRYFLPVANVINIKQAGALLDERTFYGFDGWEIRERDGVQYAFPILGPQFGFSNDQGDGTVGDLRSEVDADMDPVYQDELILGFQQVLSPTWSWGVRGIYRKLTNAIDDINITATHCGRVSSTWVMGNPGEDMTIWGDTDCDGEDDGYLTIDTSQAGYWTESDEYEYDAAEGEWNYVGSTPTGQWGYVKPKRTYKALEFVLDRAWDDKWAFNASYTLAYSEGNAEGPVNTDTNFADAGRTENFDRPWVNYRGDGPLANDFRHQVKMRGSYALNDNWRFGGTVDARSGGPITAGGVGNPFDWRSYHSYYVCVENCTAQQTYPDPQDGDTWSTADRVFEHSPRGGAGRMPWIVNFGASVTYERDLGWGNFQAKLAAYNIFNRQEPVWVYQKLESGVGSRDELFGKERFLQGPRYAQLTLALSF